MIPMSLHASIGLTSHTSAGGVIMSGMGIVLAEAAHNAEHVASTRA